PEHADRGEDENCSHINPFLGSWPAFMHARIVRHAPNHSREINVGCGLLAYHVCKHASSSSSHVAGEALRTTTPDMPLPQLRIDVND
ncbi:MAG: hypothetical protein ACXWC0_19075, partial [Burkholderiales bacterium]